jgi:hypothetical protein
VRSPVREWSAAQVGEEKRGADPERGPADERAQVNAQMDYLVIPQMLTTIVRKSERALADDLLPGQLAQELQEPTDTAVQLDVLIEDLGICLGRGQRDGPASQDLVAVGQPLGQLARKLLAKLRIHQGGFDFTPDLRTRGIRRQRRTHPVRRHLRRAMQFKYVGQGGPGGVGCLAKFDECRLGEDSPAPLRTAAENDLDHGHREKDYH